MFAISISEKGGETKRLEFDKPEITIGRVTGNDVVLPKGNVSKRHSRIVLKDGKFIVVDLKSTNGTYVNGRKISSPIVVKGSDKVYIGDFVISVEEAAAEPSSEPAPLVAPPRRTAPPPPPPPRRSAPNMPTMGVDGGLDAAGGQVPPPLAPPDAMSDSAAAEFEDLNPGPARSTRMLGGAMSNPPGLPASTPAPVRPSQSRRATVMGESGSPNGSAPAAPPSGRSLVPPVGFGAVEYRQEPGMGSAVGSSLPPPPAPPPPIAPPFVEPAPSGELVARATAIEALRAAAAKLIEQLNLDGLSPEQLSDPHLWQRAERVAADIANELGGSGIGADAIAHDAVAEVLGNGPIDALLSDPAVSEIRLPRYDRILVERHGDRMLSDRFFSSPDALARAIGRLAAGQEIQGGLIDVRLADGHQLVAALPPLAAQPALTIRRPRHASTLAQLVAAGVLSQRMADLLALAVRSRRSILVSGEPAAARAALLSALQRESDPSDVVVVLGDGNPSDAAATNVSLAGAGSPQRALAAALRLNPDRLVVTEDAAAITLEALAALPGTLVGLAGSSSVDAISRLVTAARLHGGAADADAVRDGIASELQVVATLGRGGDGRARVCQIAEVDRLDARGRASLADIFVYKNDGTFAATGRVPAFAEGAAASLFKN